MMVGRPTDCTPEVVAAVERALRAGFSNMASAQAGGISVSTFYDWVQRGKAGEAPFSDFSEMVQHARQDGLRKIETTVLKAAKVDPKVAFAILRARNPREWGGVQRVEHSGPEGGPVQVQGLVPAAMTDEQIAAALARLEGRDP